MGFGDYPAEYNPRVHGPYDPARYYGKGKWFIFFNSGIFQIDDLSCPTLFVGWPTSLP